MNLGLIIFLLIALLWAVAAVWLNCYKKQGVAEPHPAHNVGVAPGAKEGNPRSTRKGSTRDPRFKVDERVRVPDLPD